VESYHGSERRADTQTANPVGFRDRGLSEQQTDLETSSCSICKITKISATTASRLNATDGRIRSIPKRLKSHVYI
jgi:hypothetical protein